MQTEIDGAPVAQSIPDAPYKWSGAKTPPAIGDRVTITFNNLDAGRVVGYRIIEGYLGVFVHLEKNPEWRERAGYSADVPALVFGAELQEQRA